LSNKYIVLSFDNVLIAVKLIMDFYLFEKGKNMKTFDFFMQLTQIPRPSHHEEKIVDFLKNYAISHNFEYITDKNNNIIIKKDNKGVNTVALQAHIDMVCEKNADIQIDFLTQPIKTQIQGDWISGCGTTLGGDDGSGVALILNALENYGQGYPNIEAIFTSCEEVGLDGVKHLDCSPIKSKCMIGIDSTSSDEIVVSCAMSNDWCFEKNIEFENKKVNAKLFSISRLLGGHSGDDIHLKRANANKCVAEFLATLDNVQLCEFCGGEKFNTIPRSAKCCFVTDGKDLEHKFEQFKNDFAKKYDCETSAEILLEDCQSEKVLDEMQSAEIVSILNEFQNGVLENNQNNLPITSINLSVVELKDNKIEIKTMFRTNKFANKEKYLQVYKQLASKFGFDFSIIGESPMFERTGGKLLEIAQKTYEKLFNAMPKIIDVHAGLEGGVFASKMQNVDVINLGADLCDIHTPSEKMKISSLDKLDKWLQEILHELA